MRTTTTRTEIEFDLAKLEDLKIRYRIAELQGRETFTFEGQQVLTRYAKYLIEYLEQRLVRRR